MGYEVDYNFIKRQKKASSKELLQWLDLPVSDYPYVWGTFNRHMQVLEQGAYIRVSCLLKDFDRWANSQEIIFELSKKAGRNSFIDWVEEQRQKGEEK